MKTHKDYLARLPRVVKTGAALGAAIFATSTLQAQQDSTLPVPNNPPPVSTEPSGGISHRAKEFLKEAAEGNQTEIAMATVALSKSQNTQVKDLAQMLQSDHEGNYQQLQAIAQAHGVTVATSPDWLKRREVNHLQNANAADFDRDYTKMMLKDHVKCIKRFDRAAADIDEQDVKQYAQDTLPKLRTHLQRTEEVARAVGVDESTISSILGGLPSEDRSVTSR